MTRRLEDFVVDRAAAALLRRHRPEDAGRLARPPELWVDHARPDRWSRSSASGSARCRRARYGGFRWRESAALGALMNTRGLTELIVLNIGLELGLISPALFTMLVAHGARHDVHGRARAAADRPARRASEPPEEDARAGALARDAGESRVAEHSILVAPQDERNLDALLALAEPLARSRAAAELDPRAAARRRRASRPGSPRDDRAARGGDRRAERGADAARRARRRRRVVAFTSPDTGRRPRPARDGRDDRPRPARRPPAAARRRGAAGEVGQVLADAPCDVAVLVERERGVLAIDADHPVVVPFGGAEHDWAALELGVLDRRRAPTPAAPARRGVSVERRARREPLLANASLVVQQLTGVVAEPVLVEPGRRSVLRAARGRRRCSWSASPSAGARRASASCAPSIAKHGAGADCCSSAAASARARSRAAATTLTRFTLVDAARVQSTAPAEPVAIRVPLSAWTCVDWRDGR